MTVSTTIGWIIVKFGTKIHGVASSYIMPSSGQRVSVSITFIYTPLKSCQHGCRLLVLLCKHCLILVKSWVDSFQNNCYLTQWHPGGYGPAVNPEGHPGQHDHQSSREVGLQQKEEDVTPQGEVDIQTIVPALEKEISSLHTHIVACQLLIHSTLEGSQLFWQRKIGTQNPFYASGRSCVLQSDMWLGEGCRAFTVAFQQHTTGQLSQSGLYSAFFQV